MQRLSRDTCGAHSNVVAMCGVGRSGNPVRKVQQRVDNFSVFKLRQFMPALRSAFQPSLQEPLSLLLRPGWARLSSLDETAYDGCALLEEGAIFEAEGRWCVTVDVNLADDPAVGTDGHNNF